MKFSGKIITSAPGYFSIENSLFKNIFGHNFCFCQPIFKTFVAHVTTNLVLNTASEIFFLPLNKLQIISENSLSDVKNSTLKLTLIERFCLKCEVLYTCTLNIFDQHTERQRLRWTHIHPDHWSAVEVASWLNFVADEHSFTPDERSNTLEVFESMTGSQLLSMSCEDFLMTDPSKGGLLFEVFKGVYPAGKAIK